MAKRRPKKPSPSPRARPPARARARAESAESSGSPASPGSITGPPLDIYEQGIRAMYRQKWGEAARLFARVAEAADEPELQERARQQLAICRARQEEEKDRRPPADDPFLLAVFLKNRGSYAEALQLCARGGRQSKDERFAYLAASIHALSGQEEEAARFLELAIELNPKNRVHAFHDPDFAPLRGRPEHGHLFGR